MNISLYNDTNKLCLYTISNSSLGNGASIVNQTHILTPGLTDQEVRLSLFMENNLDYFPSASKGGVF